MPNLEVVASPMTISGTHITYYFICHRKLWLFRHHISMEHNSQAVKVGKLIDETSFDRERKSRMIDGIVNLDFLKGNTIVHEIKKSDAHEEAHIWQVRYYLYILKQKGIPAEKGVIHYPKQRQTLEVFLSADHETELTERILPEIESIMRKPQAPACIKKPFCKKCSYYEFCYV